MVGLRCNATLFPAAHSVDAFFSKLAESHLRPVVLSRTPWVLQIDGFIAEDTTHAMIQQAGRFRSSVVNTPSGYRLTSFRNSSQWGCARCGSRPAQSAFAHYVERVSSLLGLPHRQSSDLLLLRYGAGGYYRRHHDFLSPQSQPDLWNHRGPRQLTLMLYLSDNEEAAGGATRFYIQASMRGKRVDVQPRRGRVVVWQNVYGRKPLVRDERTFHEATTLSAGTKYVATTWYHACDP
ncbi:hypothetical protein AB1Y20_017544 [Prymnesium parvum]|uniref:Fe2OG dioxygenase domain-containing protein n=1 Tax=Prymnesium parvum TaxID=97485 RepID=A0AB34JLX3_PRYPA